MENLNYRNCNEELAIKIIGKLTLEMPELEVNLPKQLEIKRYVEEIIYNYEVTSKETALVTSDLDGKINYFLATKKLEGLSAATLKNYTYTLRKLEKFFNKPASTISTGDIKMFMYSESNTKSPAGLNTFMTPIRLFFKFLQNEEFIVKDPCASIKPVKEPKREKKPLTEEQVEMLRDCLLSKRDRAILEFFLSTGCRVAEVGNVKISDIDFVNKTLLVIGKGNKERRVYFTERCKRAIMNYLKERSDNTDYLFVSSRAPYKKLNNRGYQVIVDKMQKMANIEMNITPHTFRHTMATFALRSGMAPECIQQILGHNDVGLTLRVYAKLAQTEVEYSYRKLVS
ncbi:MAG: tyrosine-type recombinase/integrase [Terrisporobacter othiniensis]|uniref:tyrosine-type recombinase/integrase n=1 Tax=Terrisporobacter othiniensis TaxID=1577792 RepID=UPI002A75164A|nr:tyrosine-type recombinase/integrase [Terrisporobacter othiniensis]MDY3373303.1 tyrosine-type recombinase/integrase [Terrisporobacter othiniensis]